MKKIIWEDVIDNFSEEQRHYNGKYLEISEVYDNSVEIQLYSHPYKDFEIYLNYGKMFGVIFISKEIAYERYQEVKNELEKEILKNGIKPSNIFINEFCKKYDVTIPNDIFFSF